MSECGCGWAKYFATSLVVYSERKTKKDGRLARNLRRSLLHSGNHFRGPFLLVRGMGSDCWALASWGHPFFWFTFLPLFLPTALLPRENEILTRCLFPVWLGRILCHLSCRLLREEDAIGLGNQVEFRTKLSPLNFEVMVK